MEHCEVACGAVSPVEQQEKFLVGLNVGDVPEKNTNTDGVASGVRGEFARGDDNVESLFACSEVDSLPDVELLMKIAEGETYKEKIRFVLDGGATNHMTNRADLVARRSGKERLLQPAVGPSARSEVVDWFSLHANSNDVDCRLKIRNGIFCDRLAHNLIAERLLLQDGWRISEDKKRLYFPSSQTGDGRPFVPIEWDDDGLFYVTFEVERIDVGDAQQDVMANSLLLHRRFVHMNGTGDCLDCPAVKSRTLSHAKERDPLYRAQCTGDIVSTDLCGPISPPSIGGEKYIQLYCDDYDGGVEGYGLKSKSSQNTARTLRDYKKKHGPVKCIRCDGGAEFRSHFQDEAKLIRRSARYSPSQNGSCEVMNRVTIQGIILLLRQAKLPARYWMYALKAFLFVLFRVPRRRNPGGLSSYELRRGFPPSTRNLRVFGCMCWYKQEPRRGGKLEAKFKEARFVGYGEEGPTYHVEDLATGKFYYTRNVVFREDLVPEGTKEDDDAPFQAMLAAVSHLLSGGEESAVVSGERSVRFRDTHEVFRVSESGQTRKSIRQTKFDAKDQNDVTRFQRWHVRDSSPHPSRGPIRQVEIADQPAHEDVDANVDDCGGVEPCANMGEARGDMETTEKLAANSGATSPEHRKAQLARANALHEVLCEQVNSIFGPTISGADRAFQLEILDEEALMEICNVAIVPMAEALTGKNHKRWIASMIDEEKGIENSWVWVPMEEARAAGRRPLPSRFVLTEKNPVGDAPPRLKSRIVVIGYLQDEDGHSNFAPVARLNSFRLACGVACEYDWELDGADVDNAFVRAPLAPGEQVFVLPPKGFSSPRPGWIWKLTHSLYGLRRSARHWNNFLSEKLKAGGFHRLEIDRCVFVNYELKVIIVVYVDDLALIGARGPLEEGKKYIFSAFPCKDLGPLKVFLGINITRNRNLRTLRMDQTDYVLRTLAKFGMENCNTVALPMENKLVQSGSPMDPDYIPNYRSCVGALGFLQCYTGPDLAYPMSSFSKYCDPTKTRFEHQTALKHFLRYVASRKHACIVFIGGDKKKQPRLQISGWSDSDWAGDPDSGRSTGGWLCCLNGTVISWSAKLQEFTALSVSEAEYVTISYLGQEVEYERNLLEEFAKILPAGDVDLDLPSIIKEDNVAAIEMVAGAGSARTKHIKTRHHYSRELSEKKVIEVDKVDGTENVADLGTKPCKNRKNATRLWKKVNYYLDGFPMES